MANPTDQMRAAYLRPAPSRFHYWLFGWVMLIAGVMLPTVSEAATYACKNADGIVEFQVTRCARADKPRTVRRPRAANRSRAVSRSRASEYSKRQYSKRQYSKRRHSKRKPRKTARARNGFDAATCRSYKNLIDQSRSRGVEYVNGRGISSYRKTPEAMRKLRKAEQMHQRNCG